MKIENVPPFRVLPAVSQMTARFWRGGLDGRLLIARCNECYLWIHPPSPVCRRCWSTNIEPQPVSGYATVETYSINRHSWAPGPSKPPSYVVAVVGLREQEGLRLTTNIVNCLPEAVKLGLRVRVLFEVVADIALPLFEPVPTPPSGRHWTALNTGI